MDLCPLAGLRTPDESIVRIRVSDPVFTDTFHHSLIVAPELGPIHHVVVAGIVDAANFAPTVFFLVGDDSLSTH
jgi:hypothetical protein